MKTVSLSQIYFSSLIILFVSINTLNINAQTQLDPEFLWAASAGGFAYDNSRDVITDNAGNIYITGSYDVSAEFGDTILVTETQNVFIAKLDGDGNFLWAKSVLLFGTIEVVTITLDNSENIIIAGNFDGRFELETGEELLSLGGFDVFIIKYTPDGDLIWLNQFGDANNSFVNDISTDTFNNIYFTGYHSEFTSASDQIYTAAFNEAGEFQWQRTVTGSGFYDKGTGICVNTLNNIFVTGAFEGTKIFEGSTASTPDSIVISNGITDIFLAQYDLSGNLIRVQNVNKPEYDEGGKISADNNGNVVLTGITGALNGADVYLAKYSDAGDLIWENLVSFFPYNNYPKLALDNAGNISVIFLSSLGDSELRGLGEIYFSRVNSQGEHLWNTNFGSFDFDDPGDVNIDVNGDIVISGGYSVEGFFGDTTLISVQASRDIFVTKIATPKISANPAIVNFGDVTVGENLLTQISIENTTGTTLYFSNILLIEENLESNFSMPTTMLIDSLSPFQSIPIELLFTPQTTGFKTGYLIFETDAPTSPDTVIITGRGMINSLTISPDTLNFGSLDVNLSSELTFTIFNDGTETILLSDILITGPNENEFGLIGQLQDSIPPLDSRIFRVIYTPSVAGPKNASLNILSSSTSSPDSVVLIGNAITAIVVDEPDTVIIGQPTSLNITAPQGFEVLTAQLFFKRTGEPIYEQTLLVLDEILGSYSGNIPSEYSTERGIQYYVEFSDGEIIVTFPSVNPLSSPASLEVTVDELIFPDIIVPSVYSMVSIQVVPANPEIESVLGTDYGTYNPSEWRIFQWDEQINDYLEHPDLVNNFSVGNSFWLIHKDGTPFTIRNAVSVPSIADINLTIQPGWNQVANPFAFPVDWSNIINAPLVDFPVRWNKDSLDYEYNQLVLNPWEGYWIFNPSLQTVNLSVPPVESNGDSPLAKQQSNFNPDEFFLQVSAETANNVSRDNQNFVGMVGSENILFGRNIFEAPPVSNAIRLSIVDDNNRFAQNVVPVNNNGTSWKLKLSTSGINENVFITFNYIKTAPEHFNIWLIDLNSESIIPVENSRVTVNTGAAGSMEMILIIGTESFAKETAGNISLVPAEFALHQNFPNPFNPSTTISYSLKEKSNVTLEIFDILGRKITTLVNSDIQSSGIHYVNWNGKNSSGYPVSSGIYLYQIRANKFVETKKMILLR